MLPSKDLYSISPSVVPANIPVEITITATERALMFLSDAEYLVSVYGVNCEGSDYYSEEREKSFTVPVTVL